MPEPTSPTGYRFWHGAQKWALPLEIRASRKGSHEYGPGLYLTTSLDTAKHYAKGPGSLVEIELDLGVRWLEDATLAWGKVQDFLESRSGLRHRAQVLADLQRYMTRRDIPDHPDSRLPAPVLVNLCVNHEVLTANHGPALAAFLVSQGIDASRAYDKVNESWVVVFNPAIIRQQIPRRVADVDPFASFPTLPEQQAQLQAEARSPEPEPAPARSRARLR